jgi:unsaturated rhamnogalacturonyl hydrolase
MKIKTVTGIFLAFFILHNVFGQTEFTPDSVKSACKRVGKGRLQKNMYNGWQFATLFEGAMALYDLTKEKQYLDTVVGWGEYGKWVSAYNNPNRLPGQDTFPLSFDDVCCYQVYLETYLADPAPANLPHVKAALSYIKRYTYDSCPISCKDPAWPIVDMYHMAAPIYPRAALILNDHAMYDTAYRFIVNDAKHHYNTKVHLWNSNCGDTNAARQWWSRGCGWGVCATCRLHQYMPAGHPARPWCETKIKETSAKLITLQNQTDGMWRSELFTPTMQKEASGTGFFCFQLFYAMRHGIIDTATYLGPAKKAWKGLLGCLGSDQANPNLLGYSQTVGGAPSDAFGPNSHNEYTDGAFLMAGNEFYKLLTLGITGTVDGIHPATVTPLRGPAVETVCMIGQGRTIRFPTGAVGAELFTPNGRKVGALENKGAAISTGAAFVNHSGVIIARYNYK